MLEIHTQTLLELRICQCWKPSDLKRGPILNLRIDVDHWRARPVKWNTRQKIFISKRLITHAPGQAQNGKRAHSHGPIKYVVWVNSHLLLQDFWGFSQFSSWQCFFARYWHVQRVLCSREQSLALVGKQVSILDHERSLKHKLASPAYSGSSWRPLQASPLVSITKWSILRCISRIIIK